jgi:hypothetical protein
MSRYGSMDHIQQPPRRLAGTVPHRKFSQQPQQQHHQPQQNVGPPFVGPMDDLVTL